MALIIKSRSLMDAPNGAFIGIHVRADTKCDVVKSQPPWLLIKLPDGSSGWLLETAVDQSPNATVTGAVDKDHFAQECVSQAAMYGVSAHYMMAVAELRTHVAVQTDANGDIGPFALSPDEWAFFGKTQEFPLDFQATDIQDWRAQCYVFAIMQLKFQSALAMLIDDEPTATELYFAQLVGTSPCKRALADLSQPIAGIIGASASGLDNEGIDRSRISARAGTLIGVADCQAAMNKIGGAMQDALDTVRGSIQRAGAESLDNTHVPIDVNDSATVQIDLTSSAVPKNRGPIAKKIIDAFAGAGFGAPQQIAAVANAIAESGLNPSATGDGGASIGLFQMNRAAGLGKGHSVKELSDPDRNITIMLDYIKSLEPRSGFGAAHSISNAVSIFVRRFERPRFPDLDVVKRTNIATKLAASIQA